MPGFIAPCLATLRETKPGTQLEQAVPSLVEADIGLIYSDSDV
jgi:hypothetical protein